MKTKTFELGRQNEFSGDLYTEKGKGSLGLYMDFVREFFPKIGKRTQVKVQVNTQPFPGAKQIYVAPGQSEWATTKADVKKGKSTGMYWAVRDALHDIFPDSTTTSIHRIYVKIS